jgi:hypothetical protein
MPVGVRNTTYVIRRERRFGWVSNDLCFQGALLIEVVASLSLNGGGFLRRIFPKRHSSRSLRQSGGCQFPVRLFVKRSACYLKQDDHRAEFELTKGGTFCHLLEQPIHFSCLDPVLLDGITAIDIASNLCDYLNVILYFLFSYLLCCFLVE